MLGYSSQISMYSLALHLLKSEEGLFLLPPHTRHLDVHILQHLTCSDTLIK